MSELRVEVLDDEVTLGDAAGAEVFTYVRSTATCGYGGYGGRTVRLDDAPATEVAHGDVVRERRDLGTALGSDRIGLKHLRIAPHGLSAPPHCHSHEEEAFVVLSGSGTLELWDQHHRIAEHPVAAGDAHARPPATGVSHAFRAGPDGLELLAFGTRDATDMCFYPRSRKVSLDGLGVTFRIEPLKYWDGEPS